MKNLQSTLSTAPDSVFLSMGIYQEQGLSNLLDLFGQQRKWMYVISDTMRCRKGLEGVLHVPLDNKDEKAEALIHIISAGQASAIFTDDLVLDDIQQERIRQLCHQHDVVIINVTRPVRDENLIYGPW